MGDFRQNSYQRQSVRIPSRRVILVGELSCMKRDEVKRYLQQLLRNGLIVESNKDYKRVTDLVCNKSRACM